MEPEAYAPSLSELSLLSLLKAQKFEVDISVVGVEIYGFMIVYSHLGTAGDRYLFAMKSNHLTIAEYYSYLIPDYVWPMYRDLATCYAIESGNPLTIKHTMSLMHEANVPIIRACVRTRNIELLKVIAVKNKDIQLNDEDLNIDAALTNNIEIIDLVMSITKDYSGQGLQELRDPKVIDHYVAKQILNPKDVLISIMNPVDDQDVSLIQHIISVHYPNHTYNDFIDQNMLIDWSTRKAIGAFIRQVDIDSMRYSDMWIIPDEYKDLAMKELDQIKNTIFDTFDVNVPLTKKASDILLGVTTHPIELVPGEGRYSDDELKEILINEVALINYSKKWNDMINSSPQELSDDITSGRITAEWLMRTVIRTRYLAEEDKVDIINMLTDTYYKDIGYQYFVDLGIITSSTPHTIINLLINDNDVVNNRFLLKMSDEIVGLIYESLPRDIFNSLSRVFRMKGIVTPKRLEGVKILLAMRDVDYEEIGELDFDEYEIRSAIMDAITLISLFN